MLKKKKEGQIHCFPAPCRREDCLLLAHHRDDQAETLLLQLFRGAGIDGLSAMQPVKQFANARLLRPLLQYSRKDIEAYAKLPAFMGR